MVSVQSYPYDSLSRLAQDAQAGDAKARAELWLATHEILRRVYKSRFRDREEAEDAASEFMLIRFPVMVNRFHPCPPGTWEKYLTKCAWHYAVSCLRTRARRMARLYDNGGEPASVDECGCVVDSVSFKRWRVAELERLDSNAALAELSELRGKARAAYIAQLRQALEGRNGSCI